MKAFEAYLRSLYPEHPTRVQEAELYSLLAPGKRIRPRLLLAALQGYGIDVKQGYPAAAALEMIHTYSLIHDDLPAMDDDELRRGRPTCHKAFDEATAILAGDALLTKAFETASLCDASIVADVVRILAQAAGDQGMIQGQMDDIALEGMETTDITHLQQVHHNKTGQLLQAPLTMAAVMAGHKQDLTTLRQAGFLIGLAFQIQDDILDATSSPDQLGKTTSDVQNHKITYASLLGVEQSGELLLQTYEKALQLLYQTSMEPTYVVTIVEELMHRKK